MEECLIFQLAEVAAVASAAVSNAAEAKSLSEMYNLTSAVPESVVYACLQFDFPTASSAALATVLDANDVISLSHCIVAPAFK